MSIDVLAAELSDDPLTRGYSGMNDAEAAADLNTAYRTRGRATMTGSEIMNEIDKSEWDALLPTAQQTVWNILHLGEVNPFGVEATLMVDVFGGGSDTITALAQARMESITRAEELGLTRIRPGTVAEARAS